MIVAYDDSAHRAAVLVLWQTVFGYESAHNDPALALGRKVAMGDGLFWVAVEDGEVVGTIMAGYDGHRGWLYSVAVLEEKRNSGLGSALMEHAEEVLRARGCVKINLQILAGNDGVESFDANLGFVSEARISMGKVLYQKRDNEN